jgi:RNA polymerase sigma-70 factor (ECF subfamily)
VQGGAAGPVLKIIWNSSAPAPEYRTNRAANRQIPAWVVKVDDQHLLRAIARRDEGAVIELYRRYSGPLFRFALHVTGNVAAAEEAMQETFLTVIREPEIYNPARGAVAAFLFGIARNHIRRASERNRMFISTADFDCANPDDYAANSAREHDLARIRRAVNALPTKYREVVALCDLEGLGYEQAAAILDCPVGTVRSRLHRARALLIERMRPDRAVNRSTRCLA